MLDWTLIIFAFGTSITPGPNNIMLMSSGLNHGFKKTIPHMLDISTGFLTMLGIVSLGLGHFILSTPWLTNLMLFICGLILVWLAWKMVSARPPAELAEADRPKPWRFWQAVLFQWINPKAWAMCLMVLPFADPTTPVLSAAYIVLAFGLASFPCETIWVVSGMSLRQIFHQPLWFRIINCTLAFVLVASFLYAVFR